MSEGWKSTSYPLKFPRTVDGKKYTEISFTEPDVDGIEAIEELGLEEGKDLTIKQIRALIVILSGVPNKVLGKCHRDDLMGMGEILGPLLDGGDETKTDE